MRWTTGTKGGDGGDESRGKSNTTISDAEWGRLHRDPVESPKSWARITSEGNHDSYRNRERN
jgi:hypothetical protein